MFTQLLSIASWLLFSTTTPFIIILVAYLVFLLVFRQIFFCFNETILHECRHQKYDFEFWKRRGVSGPKPLPFLGNSLEPFLTPALQMYKSRFEKYGRFFGFYEQSKPVLSIAEPELLRYVMVKDSDSFVNRRNNNTPEPLIKNMLTSLRDDRWKRVRALMSPTFTSGKIKKMTEIVNNCVKSLIDSLDSKVKNGENVDVKALYGAFTMDVIASCAFATKTNSHNNPNDPFVINAKNFFNFKIWRILIAVFIPPFLRDLTKFKAIPGEVIDFFRTTTKAIIKQRQSNNAKFDDFMQLLLDAQKSIDLTQTIKDINSEQLNTQNAEETESTARMLSTAANDPDTKLTEDELLAQCLIFFVAGYETTASLLSSSSYGLALNPHCQEMLYTEVKHHFDADGEINYENINKMKYLNAVINESLRLYTPVIRVDREATKDYTFPNTDVTIPKGTLVQIPLYTIHHDENNFTDPFEFKPERFLPENVDEIKPYTFLPFGSGPRNCIGMRFALMEAKLALCNLILRYKFAKCDETDVPLKMKRFTIVMFPVDRIVLKFEKRASI